MCDIHCHWSLTDFDTCTGSSKLDYCNSVLVGVTRTLQRQLCRGSTGVLSHEIGTRDATSPWPSLVKGTGADPVSFMCSYLPLPSRHHAILPGWNTASVVYCRITLSTPFQINIDITCADHTTNYTWRSSISSGRCMGLKCSAGICQNYWIVHYVQVTDKNAAVEGNFQRASCYCCCDCRHVTLLFVQCPCTRAYLEGDHGAMLPMGQWLQIMVTKMYQM